MALHVVWSDPNIFQVISEIIIQLMHLCSVTNVFTTAKFLVITFSCFFKHQISLFFIKLLTTMCDWKFMLIRTFNNRKCFLDDIENIFDQKLFFLNIFP